MDCIFCKIASGNTDTRIIYQDDELVAFDDINPRAPVHILIIPKKHIPSLNHIDDTDLPVINKMIAAAKQIARQANIYDTGYRLIINTGSEGGQVIQHLHMHLLGGRRLKG